VDTIYIGGGTPTMLPPALLEQILMMCRDAFAVAPKAEISLEANPGTVTIDNLHRLRTAGVNRLSLGAQSFRAAELRLLQRIHSADQIGQAFQMARAAGFDNVNLDLIYGLPGQTLADWEFNLEQAFALKPEHLSLYALSVEEGTPLANRIASGLLPQPDPDLAAEMYSLAEERLASASYAHYELSNWASLRVSKDSVTEVLACRHNLKHWRVQPYLGFGAGAHSYYGGYRYSNVLRPEKYISRIERGSSPVEERHAIGPAESMAETMILGLRLTEGVRFADFRLRHGRNLCAEYATELSELDA
jgi:oxygen-independent coproporphyrinogen-3 oxidase